MRIVIYQKPTCTTCRQVYAALKESGVDFEAVDYYTDPIPKAKLKELLRKMGCPHVSCCGQRSRSTRPCGSPSAI